MTREHDRPDQNLIITGARRVQPSKRGLGEDYPITLVEERLLEERNKSKRMKKEIRYLKKLTFGQKQFSTVWQNPPTMTCRFQLIRRLGWRRVRVV